MKLTVKKYHSVPPEKNMGYDPKKGIKLVHEYYEGNYECDISSNKTNFELRSYISVHLKNDSLSNTKGDNVNIQIK